MTRYSKKSNLISKVYNALGGKPEQMLYIFNNGGTNHYKIGITKDLCSRYSDGNTFASGGINIIKVLPLDTREEARFCEKALHKYYKQFRTRPEQPRHEWFALCKAEVTKLCELETKKDLLEFCKKIVDSQNK